MHLSWLSFHSLEPQQTAGSVTSCWIPPAARVVWSPAALPALDMSPHEIRAAGSGRPANPLPPPSPSPDNLDEPDNFNHRWDRRLITALLSAGASAPQRRAAAQPRQGQSGFTSPSAPTNSSWKQPTAPPLPSDRSDRLHLLTFIKNGCVFCSAGSFDLIFKSPLLAAVRAVGRVIVKMKDFLQELHRSHTSCVALELKEK